MPYAKLSYNNSSYQASLRAAPFEVLYGRKCGTPWNWSETGERILFGPQVIQEAEADRRLSGSTSKQSRQSRSLLCQKTSRCSFPRLVLEHAVVLRAIQLSADLSYPEHQIRVLETSERKMRNKLSTSRRCSGLIILRRGYMGV